LILVVLPRRLTAMTRKMHRLLPALFLTLVASAGTARAATREFMFTAAATRWEIAPGVAVSAYAYNGSLPGPEIHVREGDLLRITLVNRLSVPTTIHWHGVPVPNGMDGVPGVTAPVVQPGGTFTYEFLAPGPGTYWYHPHHDSAAQIARGLYGLLIVDPPEGARTWDLEVPLVVGEFGNGSMVGTGGMRDMGGGMGGMGSGMTSAGMMASMLLINGKTAPAIPEVRVKRGKKILFRMVNTGNMVHPMHVHGLHWDVLATDGFDVPTSYRKDTLPVNAGERFDASLLADNLGRWLIHCHNLQHVGESAGAMTGLVFELVVE
jgi:FtsP/CotA-like multicopper oxidase with cupredoxin domain